MNREGDSEGGSRLKWCGGEGSITKRIGLGSIVVDGVSRYDICDLRCG